MEKGATVNYLIQDCPQDSVFGGLSMFRDMLNSIDKHLPKPRYFITENAGYRQVSFIMEMLDQRGYKNISPVLFNKTPHVLVAFRDPPNPPQA